MSFHLNKSLENKLTILSYHGVTEKNDNEFINVQGKHILKEDFQEQMEFINNFCSPLSIDEWIQLRAEQKKMPPYPTVVSFDDGFKNNLDQAIPVLEKLSIPCIFYISSGMINSDEMFWVDKIEQCLAFTKEKKISLFLDLLKYYKIDSYEKRIKLLIEIKSWCKSHHKSETERVIAELISETRISPQKDMHQNYNTLTWDDLRFISNNDLFTIGGHSHSHSILSTLSDEELEIEVTNCTNEISRKLKIEINHFSYPEGQENHYNENVISLLKRVGIMCCPTAIYGFNDIDDDLFHLKRVMVGFNGIKFPHDFPVT